MAEDPQCFWPSVGERVRLKANHTGVVYGLKRHPYAVREAKAGDCGVRVDAYTVIMDDWTEISCVGNDFEDPDQQFAGLFEPILSGA